MAECLIEIQRKSDHELRLVASQACQAALATEQEQLKQQLFKALEEDGKLIRWDRFAILSSIACPPSNLYTRRVAADPWQTSNLPCPAPFYTRL